MTGARPGLRGAPFVGAGLVIAGVAFAACGGGSGGGVDSVSPGAGGTGGESHGSGGSSAGAGGSLAGAGGSNSGAGGGSGAAGAAPFCKTGMTTSFPVPAGAACMDRPPADLSGCGAGTSLEECLSMHIAACGPKCGCSCVALHLDAAGCVTSVDSSEAPTSLPLKCLLDQLSSERFGTDLPASILARLGGCNVC